MAQWKQLPFRCITPLLREKMMKVPGFARISPDTLTVALQKLCEVPLRLLFFLLLLVYDIYLL